MTDRLVFRARLALSVTKEVRDMFAAARLAALQRAVAAAEADARALQARRSRLAARPHPQQEA